MDLSGFTQGRTRETAIRRDHRGHWFNGPDEITHLNLVQNFNAWIDRAPDGRFCLTNAINWAYIAIEGPPFWVRSVEIQGGGEVAVNLSGGLRENVKASEIFVDEESTLWCAVKNGRCPARFDNHAALQLASHLKENNDGMHLRLGDADHRLRTVEDPMNVGATP